MFRADCTHRRIFLTYVYYIYGLRNNYRRKFRSQTSDNMDRWKAEQGRGREKRKIRRKEDGDARKGRKVAKHSEGRKVGALKRRVRSQLARWAMKNCTLLWREADFQVKMYKTHQCRTTFGSWDVEKVHTVVARSTFASQNVEDASAPDHFWKLRCRKSARRCAKHISKSKCTKRTIVGPLLEVAMSKKCTPLWREAYFQVKMYKNTSCLDHFWKFRCRKSARRCGAKHISKSKCTKHHMFVPLLEVRMSKKCTLLWREGHFEVKMLKTPGVRTTFGGSDVASLQYITLQDITLHYTPVHYITLHYTPVHSTTLNYITPHYITLNDTATQIDR